MNSLYQAYQAYERRVTRGEFSRQPAAPHVSHVLYELLEDWLGNLMIKAGRNLKRRAVAGKAMAWASLTGSKQ